MGIFPIARIAAALALASALHAAEISVTLATKSGQTRFRQGESIELTAKFESSSPGRYRLWTTNTNRRVRVSRFDRFLADPRDGTADPLADMAAQYEGLIGGLPPAPVPLGSGPVTLDLCLNEWLSFRRPGRYRISLETTRVERAAAPNDAVPLRSNGIEVEIVAPEPGWAAAETHKAVALLERGDPPPPQIGEIVNAAEEQAHRGAMAEAARVLRFLETREAVRPLVRFFEHGPQAAQNDLHAGLFASPYRAEVISAFEEALADPEVPVTYYYVATLIELAAASRLGPSPLYPAGTPDPHAPAVEAHGEYLKRMQPVETEYFGKLAEALGRKRGPALSATLDTLVTRGPQPPAAATVSALLAHFESLPAGSQFNLLTSEWPRIASPDAGPWLRTLAGAKGPLRDEALARLWEIDPAAARAVTLTRLGRGDIAQGMFGNPRALLTLPDRTVPELDDVLAGMLEEGKPVALLVARYASDAVRRRVREHAEKTGSFCGPLAAYFFRVDPAYAAENLAAARSRGGCVLALSPNEDLLMSPGLEEAAVRDLSSPDPMVRRSAQSLLQSGGSPECRDALWTGLAGLRGAQGPLQMLEFGFVEALSRASGWVLGAEEMDRLEAACVTAECRNNVRSSRRALQPPVRITLMAMPGSPYASVGPFLVRSRQELERKAAQFPKRTKFLLDRGYECTWFRTHRAAEIRDGLSRAGMELAAEAAR